MFRIIITATLLVLCAPFALAKVTIIHNVKGYTLTGNDPLDSQLHQFNSLAFEHGKVLQTGDYSVLKKAFFDADLIDGKGNTLLPGLIDAHGHILGLGANLANVELRNSTSEKQAANLVATFMDNNASQRWIVGRGWNQELWDIKQFPTKASLDAVSKDKPIVLSRVDGHAIWVNSKALSLAGIDKDTVDPAGGQIIKDANGEPTGVLVDNAELLVTDMIPDKSSAEKSALLDKAFEHMLSLGITGAHDAGVGADVVGLLQQKRAQNQLPLRVYGMLNGAANELESWLKQGWVEDQQDLLSVRSVKLYSDGALGSRGAAMLQGYTDEPENKGLLVTSEKDLDLLTEMIVAYNFQANIHAIGDRGNRLTINAIEKAIQKHPDGKQLRHRIEHAQVISLKDIPRIKSLNLIASMQPVHATSDMNMAENRVGPARILGAYAWRSLIDKGIVVASGSDFPVELANPFHGLHAAVVRQNHHNQPEGGWQSHEKMTVVEALQTFTLNAAYAAHQEDKLGTLEAGKWADFVLVDQDIFAINPQDIWKTKVQQTWVAGQRRH